METKIINWLKGNWFWLILSLGNYLLADYSQKGLLFNKMNWGALIISLLYTALLIFVVRHSVKKEYNNKNKETLNELENLRKHVEKINDIENYKMNNAVMSMLIRNGFNEYKDISVVAEYLYNESESKNIDINKWKNYGVPDNVIKEMENIHDDRYLKNFIKIVGDATKPI